MHELPELLRRHQVDPGPLTHVGAARDVDISAFYDAGFIDITVVDDDPTRVRALRTRFPGVGVEASQAVASAPVVVVNSPGREVVVLDDLAWDELTLLIVATNSKAGADVVSPCDLVTEAVTTRGFVEVYRWTRQPNDGTDVNVAFLRP